MSIEWDKHKPGCGRFVLYDNGGRRYITFKDLTPEAALEYHRTLLSQMGKIKIAVYPSVSEALPSYTTYYRTIATERIVDDMLSIMDRCLLPKFGMLMAHQIVPIMVYDYTAYRLKTVCHRTVQKELNHLSAMTKWMHLNGMAEKKPDIPKPPKSKTLPQRISEPLTLDESTEFLKQIDPDKIVLILLMMDAGLRVSEALNLKTENIDLPGWRIKVKGKGGKVVLYPVLTQRLYEALSACSGEYVSCNVKTGEPFGSLKKMVDGAARRAGIKKHVTHHTLRHTFSVLLMEAGISTEVRRLLMRHSSLQATEHYTHVSPDYLAKQGAIFSETINTRTLSPFQKSP